MTMPQIDPKDIPPEELARYRTRFALRRLSTGVQNAVLLDGIIAAQMGIDLTHPVRLPDDITVDRAVLFAAFQRAADGELTLEIFDTGGVKRDMKLEIEGDAAVLTYGTHRVSFPQAILLSANPIRRKEAPRKLLIALHSRPSLAHNSKASSPGLPIHMMTSSVPATYC